MKSYGVTIQMKATKQYFPVVMFIMLYKVVLTFESVDEILWCEGHKRILFQGDLVLSRGIETLKDFKPLCKILEKVNPPMRRGQENRIQEFPLPCFFVSVIIIWYSQTSESNPFISVDIKGIDPSVDITKVSVLDI